MLTVQGLHLWRGDRHVLRGVSFTLEPGRCALLTGKNGAGKTTLLRDSRWLSFGPRLPGPRARAQG
jgi:ABC-type branched-subunit amino acid transport system ATPase component